MHAISHRVVPMLGKPQVKWMIGFTWEVHAMRKKLFHSGGWCLPVWLMLMPLSLYGKSITLDGALDDLYNKGGEGWSEGFRLRPPALTGGDLFGAAVAVKTVASIGNRTAILAGSPGGKKADNFGAAVCIKGDMVFIGSPGRGDNQLGGPSAGAVFLYHISDSPSSADYVGMLVPYDSGTSQGGGSFGTCIAVSGDMLVVAARAGIFYNSFVHIYRSDGVRWLDMARVEDPNPSMWSHFGEGLGVYDGYVLVGDDGAGDPSGSGLTYAYRICPDADLTGDCQVNMEDLANVAGSWLQ